MTSGFVEAEIRRLAVGSPRIAEHHPASRQGQKGNVALNGTD